MYLIRQKTRQRRLVCNLTCPMGPGHKFINFRMLLAKKRKEGREGFVVVSTAKAFSYTRACTGNTPSTQHCWSLQKTSVAASPADGCLSVEAVYVIAHAPRLSKKKQWYKTSTTERLNYGSRFSGSGGRGDREVPAVLSGNAAAYSAGLSAMQKKEQRRDLPWLPMPSKLPRAYGFCDGVTARHENSPSEDEFFHNGCGYTRKVSRIFLFFCTTTLLSRKKKDGVVLCSQSLRGVGVAPPRARASGCCCVLARTTVGTRTFSRGGRTSNLKQTSPRERTKSKTKKKNGAAACRCLFVP